MKNKLIILCLFASCALNAQNSVGKADDFGRIVLNTYIPEQVEGLTPTAANVLSSKLSQIATINGLGGYGFDPRFIITANVSVLTKDITPTAPPMHAYTLEVTFYIGDGLDGTLFASHSKTIKGVGENETKAYLAALKNIKTNDPNYQAFIDKGKNRILEFYNSRCDFIIKQANAQASTSNFEEAIFTLNVVPEVCADCYNKCLDAVGPIYQKMIDKECLQLLAEANTAWNIGQNADAAGQASEFLARIDPQSACFKDAQILSVKIGNRIRELEKRDWDFQMKQYQDKVDTRNALIKAIRDVGVAFGNNQPKSVAYNVRGWW